MRIHDLFLLQGWPYDIKIAPKYNYIKFDINS